jgi:F0F1-type ATP synthase membrane subunit b/b'
VGKKKAVVIIVLIYVKLSRKMYQKVISERHKKLQLGVSEIPT